MPRRGYLANVLNVPPLIFKFQFHPEILSEKKAFEYHDSKELGKWGFDQTAKGAGASANPLKKAASIGGGLLDDFKEFGSLLTATKALEPTAGKARTFALEFALDARAKPDDSSVPTSDPPEPRRIELDLAVLRSFMNPTLDVAALFSGKPVWTRPPTCQLKLGDIELECVMTDLNIKVTKFRPDLGPERAEVSLTLSEQTRSIATGIDVLTRNINAGRALFGGRIDKDDLLQQIPGSGFVQDAFG